jgi:hypothetical protein
VGLVAAVCGTVPAASGPPCGGCESDPVIPVAATTPATVISTAAAEAATGHTQRRGARPPPPGFPGEAEDGRVGTGDGGLPGSWWTARRVSGAVTGVRSEVGSGTVGEAEAVTGMGSRAVAVVLFCDAVGSGPGTGIKGGAGPGAVAGALPGTRPRATRPSVR